MVAAAPSAALVAWANAWLTGHVGLDEATDAIEGETGPCVVDGIPGAAGELPLRQGLGDLRVAGMNALRLALPVAGDPLGLPGPVAFNLAALEAGEAVTVELANRPIGLLPAEDRRGSSYVGVRWTVHQAGAASTDVPSLAEADHQLTTAVREATDALGTLDDVATWRPEVAEALTALRESPHREQPGRLAPGYPPRAHRVAALSGRLAVVVDLARQNEGAGLTADQVRCRTDALRALDRAVRRAQVAAYNSVFDPVR